MKTVVKRLNASGELSRIEIKDEDATSFAIAEAAIALIGNSWSMNVGDSLVVVEEPDQ